MLRPMLRCGSILSRALSGKGSSVNRLASRPPIARTSGIPRTIDSLAMRPKRFTPNWVVKPREMGTFVPAKPKLTSSGGSGGSAGSGSASNKAHLAGLAVTGIGGISALVAYMGRNKDGSVASGLGLEQFLKDQKWARKAKFGQLVGAGLILKEKIHKGSDSKVSKDPIRKKITESRQARGESIRWLELGGVVEMGVGKEVVVPVGGPGKVTVGFDTKSLLEYKSLTPMSVGKNEEGDFEVQTATWSFPTSREELLEACPGSEFEIRGYGKIKGRAGMAAGTSYGVPPANVALKASAGASDTWEGNLILRIKVLNDAGNIECSLIRDNKYEEKLESRLSAGVGVDPSSLPGVGEGFLGKLARNRGEKAIKKWFKTFASVNFDAHWRNTNQQNAMGRYLIDTATPDGLRAFQGLLGLDTEQADSLSATANSGVESAAYESTLEEAESKLMASWAGNRLLIFKALEAERSGVWKENGEKTKCFRSNEVNKVRGNFITGRREVKWDAVTFEEESKPPRTFFNLKYSNKDRVTTEREVERFFRFAKQLGVDYAHESVRNVSPDMGVLSRVFSSEDDTTVDVDIYFTKAGIDRIAASSNEEARKQFLKARALFDSKAEGLSELSTTDFSRAVEMAKEHRDLELRLEPGEPSVHMGLMKVESAYRREFGRSIEQDRTHLKRAYEFMVHKKDLQDNASPKDRREFFADLGDGKSFGFMPTVIALAKLAGDEETVINALRMKGPKIQLEAVSEGCMAHPAKK